MAEDSYGSKKIGIMQPYFFPYIGYWQMINAVDTYVIYDDVNYINRGWINRNRILVNGQVRYFNVPLLGASQNKLINAIEVDLYGGGREKTLKSIEYSYKKAPYFEKVFPILQEIMACQEKNLALYLENSINVICDYLGIKTELVRSSELKKDCSLKGQSKILAICELLEAQEYYNAIGGQELYDFQCFSNKGIELKFLKTGNVQYRQFNGLFQPNLSIVDVMMFNSREEIAEMLNDYCLVRGGKTKIICIMPIRFRLGGVA